MTDEGKFRKIEFITYKYLVIVMMRYVVLMSTEW